MMKELERLDLVELLIRAAAELATDVYTTVAKKDDQLTFNSPDGIPGPGREVLVEA